MKVPVDIAMSMTSTIVFACLWMIIPTIIPVGVKNVNIVKRHNICLSVKPVFDRAVPRAMLAVASWTMMPPPNYHAVSISLRSPNAIPSKIAWNPIAIVSMIAVFFGTVTFYGFSYLVSRAVFSS